MRILVLSNVWVEPTSSAAGSRMLQLLKIFRDQNWEVTYASTANKSEFAFDLSQLDINIATIQINDSGFDAFAKALNPQLVLFDRFMVEEQFGWRIAEHCPDAIRVLDTEDLHCLRKGREQAIRQHRGFENKELLSSELAKREIASIYRCDLTLMISTYEMELLQSIFKVPETLLLYVPFLIEEPNTNFVPFEERAHFISIGNFLHPPNWDAVLQLKQSIWPLIRKQLPQAELHVYGAYPSEKVRQLHNEKEGFIIKGRAEDAFEVLSQALVLLAPLRFGAGLKGKFVDAMQTGTPNVTTSIGAEGMRQGLDWCGLVEDDLQEFAQKAITLYKDLAHWQKAQQNGMAILQKNFKKEAFEKSLLERINFLRSHLNSHRQENFTGQLLQHHTMQSTKYLSKWIEEKNKN